MESAAAASPIVIHPAPARSAMDNRITFELLQAARAYRVRSAKLLARVGLYPGQDALLKLLGGSDPANIKDYQARFASPVKPGDTLVTQIWRTGQKDSDGFEEIRFATAIKGGKLCLSNGRAKIKVVGQRQSKL